VPEPTCDAIQARLAMAHHGSSIVDFSTVVPRYVLALMPIAITLGLGLLALGYFNVRGAFFLRAIVVNICYAVRDRPFRHMSTMSVR
jgi:hypothetical protein